MIRVRSAPKLLIGFFKRHAIFGMAKVPPATQTKFTFEKIKLFSLVKEIQDGPWSLGCKHCTQIFCSIISLLAADSEQAIAQADICSLAG